MIKTKATIEGRAQKQEQITLAVEKLM